MIRLSDFYSCEARVRYDESLSGSSNNICEGRRNFKCGQRNSDRFARVAGAQLTGANGVLRGRDAITSSLPEIA